MSKYSKEVISECIRLYESGLSLTKIQELKGINRKELSRDLKEYGISINKNIDVYKNKYLNQKDKIIQLYKKYGNITKVQKILNLDRHQISFLLIEQGILNNKKYDNKNNQQIINDYVNTNMSIRELQQKYSNYSIDYLIDILKYNNVSNNKEKNRKYFFDEQFFSKIDTEEKAYFLGFLYADGQISSRSNNYNIELSLKEEDKYILEQFAKSLNLNKKPKLKKVKLNGKIFTSYRLQFSSKEMHSDLIKLGCFPKKSLTLKFPTEEQVPNYLINHFMRGYFDGDGCIYVAENKKIQPKFSVIGTEKFLKDYQNELIKFCKLKNKTKISKKNIKNIAYTFSYGGKNQVIRIYNFLYQNQNIYLERKHKKFIAVLDGNI